MSTNINFNVWKLVSPLTPKQIKRTVEFFKDSTTNTIHIKNLSKTELIVTIDTNTVKLLPFDFDGAYVTSVDFGRKLWETLIAAGYTPIQG